MKVRIKRSGSIFIGVTVFLGVAAANTGNNLLYILVSSLLSLMLVSGITSLLNLKGIKVVLVPPPKVFAGRPASFRVLVRKKGRLPSFLIRVSSERDACLFPLVDGRLREGRLSLTFGRRGRVGSVVLRVSSDFPLGMFVRSYTAEVKVDLIVFPEPAPAEIHPKIRDRSEESGSLAGSETKGYDDIKDIRPYSGDPIKLIHWRVSAKVGDLMVREMVSDVNRPLVLSLEEVPGDLEERIRKLTYLVIKLMDLGHPVGLKLGEREIPPGRGEEHLKRLLRELALY
jgi:uncharacterized protein (DUF58 family)